MIVVDASALVAIALDEPEGDACLRALEVADRALASTINLFEASLILVVREGLFDAGQFRAWVDQLPIESTSQVTYEQALDAYLHYGKGVHRASLNLGDCFAYALAKALDAPLLFKGDDFIFTDVRRALQPT